MALRPMTKVLKKGEGTPPGKPESPRAEAVGAPLCEAQAWQNITGTWRPLYGSFFEQGVSIEWHDFTLNDDMDWSRSFHPGGVEICLNYSGSAQLQDGSANRELPAGNVAVYTTRTMAPRAVRMSGAVHRFLTIEIAPEFLRTQCAGEVDLLKAPLRHFVKDSTNCPHYLEVRPLTTGLLGVRQELIEPPVPASAREAWYRGKILEVLAQTVFREDSPGELFCARHKRRNRDRIERICYLLERDMENPPTLEMLADDVECSPFYLSRMFAGEMGMTIPKFLRMRRVERAAELLRGGTMNVTEAAFAVGYSSLSAFNRAFVELMGCCPGLYPQVKIVGRPEAH